MYEELLPADLVEHFRVASSDRCLDAEIRLLRAQIMRAVGEDPPDYRAEAWLVELLVKAVRANTSGGEGRLADLLDRVGDELAGGVRSYGSARVDGAGGTVPRPRRRSVPKAPRSGVDPDLSMGEAAAQLGVSVRSVQRMVARGELEAVDSPVDRRKRLVSADQVRARQR